MHTIAVRNFILIACILIASCFCVTPVLAGIGGTSSGVTSTVGTQGTNASPEVQQQSAGFVQQNQQLQDAQNAASPTGIVMPGGVANAAGAAGAHSAANAANPANPESGEKPGGPGSTPATPPPPPPPPPTYVSVVKHLSPGSDSADPAGTTAVAAPVVAAATPAPALVPAQGKTDTLPAPAAKVSAQPAAAAAPTAAAANAEKIGASERAAETGVISGGRGPAPDGYTFYVGFGVALLLLVIAFGAYLSSQKDEVGRRLPR